MSNKPSPDALKQSLSEMQFYVTQNHGTEPPFTGRLLHNQRDGVYHCGLRRPVISLPDKI